jgi:hypothetical protein
MAYDAAKRHHWQMMTPVHTVAGKEIAEIIACCELCGTVRRYDLADSSNSMILGGTCPGTAPEPAERSA